jgi:hypothetical protein
LPEDASTGAVGDAAGDGACGTCAEFAFRVRRFFFRVFVIERRVASPDRLMTFLLPPILLSAMTISSGFRRFYLSLS